VVCWESFRSSGPSNSVIEALAKDPECDDERAMTRSMPTDALANPGIPVPQAAAAFAAVGHGSRRFLTLWKMHRESIRPNITGQLNHISGGTARLRRRPIHQGYIPLRASGSQVATYDSRCQGSDEPIGLVQIDAAKCRSARGYHIIDDMQPYQSLVLLDSEILKKSNDASSPASNRPPLP
jgi:hypothetical protein